MNGWLYSESQTPKFSWIIILLLWWEKRNINNRKGVNLFSFQVRGPWTFLGNLLNMVLKRLFRWTHMCSTLSTPINYLLPKLILQSPSTFLLIVGLCTNLIWYPLSENTTEFSPGTKLLLMHKKRTRVYAVGSKTLWTEKAVVLNVPGA